MLLITETFAALKQTWLPVARTRFPVFPREVTDSGHTMVRRTKYTFYFDGEPCIFIPDQVVRELKVHYAVTEVDQDRAIIEIFTKAFEEGVGKGQTRQSVIKGMIQRYRLLGELPRAVVSAWYELQP